VSNDGLRQAGGAVAVVASRKEINHVSFEDTIKELVASVVPADPEAAAAAAERHDQLTKPKGSLGELEAIGIRLAAMAGRSPAPIPRRPAVVVAAGDHGVLAQGVSPWPKEVTASMVAGFCANHAAVNALAGVVGAEVTVLDVGVASDLPEHPRLRRMKVRLGTGDLSETAAMSREEAAQAVLAGASVAKDLIAGGADLLCPGDMGIGNTTPSACLIAAFAGRSPEEVTGRGTGIDDEAWALKVKVVERALEVHDPDTSDPLGVLAALGGLEHAAIAGVILAGAAARVPVVLDGVNTDAAALVACSLCPNAVGYLIAGHLSVEPGARVALEKLKLKPLVDLGMRLGEGTGALLAVPIVRAAAAALAEMATFEEAGIPT